MKRYVVLIGGSGARLAESLLCAAAAGVLPSETLEVLLADTDRRGLQGAELIRAQMRDYAQVRRLMGRDGKGFRTELNFRSWPEKLPGDAATLAEWTADSEEDRLLCQALLDAEAASLDLRAGFHGRRMLGQAVFAGLLHETQQDMDDPLGRMVDEMVQAIDAGEEVRVVLVGSVCGGTGAAGIPMLARYIRERTADRVRMGAVLMTASSDQESAANACEAIQQYAADGLCETICVLGLPQSSRTAIPAGVARLTDWLAVYCMDVLLHRQGWLEGVFTVRAEEGPLSWSVFGRAAARYRQGYGRLVKAAAAWVYCIGPKVEQRLERPMVLRDKLFGWYAHFFRKMKTAPDAQLEDAECLDRLLGVVLLWLGGISRTLPVDMRSAAVMTSAKQTAEEHYRKLVDMICHLTVLDEGIQLEEEYADSFVHRGRTDEEDEAEENIRRADAVKQEIQRMMAEQVAMNRKMGGAATMSMLQRMLDEVQQEAAELQERYDEAVRRIDHAETIAAPEDLYKIADARTKLKRMERHQEMLAGRLAHITDDMEEAVSQGLRFDKPALPPTAAENAMFHVEIADFLLQREQLTSSDVERLWSHLVLPEDGVTLKEALKAARHAPVDPENPVMSLLQALMQHSMKEEQA